MFSCRALSSFVVISSVCIHHGFLPDYTVTLRAEVLLKEQLLKGIQARAGASMSDGGSCGEGEGRVRQTRFLSSALTSPAWCSAMRGAEKEPAWSIISPVPERGGAGLMIAMLGHPHLAGYHRVGCIRCLGMKLPLRPE